MSIEQLAPSPQTPKPHHPDWVQHQAIAPPTDTTTQHNKGTIYRAPTIPLLLMNWVILALVAAVAL